MSDSIVSVRIPETLLEELKTVAAKQHYIDLSEAVRSIVKKKQTSLALQAMNTGASNQQLIEGLQTILTQLQNEAAE